MLNCRLSPRRITERDVPETAGTGGRRRRMSLRWKAKTGGPSVLMPFHLGDIRLCHPFWPSLSRRRTSPRRMAPRRMTVRRMTPRRMALRRMSPRRMTLRRMSPDVAGHALPILLQGLGSTHKNGMVKTFTHTTIPIHPCTLLKNEKEKERGKRSTDQT